VNQTPETARKSQFKKFSPEIIKSSEDEKKGGEGEDEEQRVLRLME